MLPLLMQKGKAIAHWPNGNKYIAAIMPAKWAVIKARLQTILRSFVIIFAVSFLTRLTHFLLIFVA
jgi:hypothetical protein